MMRTNSAVSTFRNCMEIIEYILDYVDKHDPAFAPCLRNFSLKMVVDLLHSPEKQQSVGALHFLSIIISRPKFSGLFATFALQIVDGVFSLMNQLSCKFNLTIQKKSHELVKNVLRLFKERFTEDNKVQQLKDLTRVVVQIIPNNKQYEQRILFNLMVMAYEGLTKRQVYEIMFDDCYTDKMEEKKITIDEILVGERFKECMPPIRKVLEYIFSTLRHYKILLERKRSQSNSGSFKELTYDDCSAITSAVVAANNIFKMRIAFKSFDEPSNPAAPDKNIEPRIEELIEIFRDFIRENEEFNEKKMNFRGSSVRPSAKEAMPVNQQGNGPAPPNNVVNGGPGGDQAPEAAAQTRQQSIYKPNPETHYQNLEFKIYADDYDFSVQGWSMLMESIINFLSSFLSRTDVHEQIKRLRGQNLPVDPNSEPAILKVRHAIIYKMFDLFSRVEFRIRDSVERGFSQLIKLEPVEKELIPRENPEICFKPFLCFMQQEYQADRKAFMSETSLYCFMKLLKLFKTCFNTDRLLIKFKESLEQSENLYQKQEYSPKEDETNQVSRIFGILGIVLSRCFD